MDDLPSDVPAHLVTAIRIALRRIHAKFLDNPDRRIHIPAAYDVYASSLMNDRRALTTDILQDRIPAWVIHWAIMKEWVSYPEYRRTDNKFVTPSGAVLENPTFAPIPEDERTVVIESYRITETHRDHLVKSMEGRIFHWGTEALLVTQPAQIGPSAIDAPTVPKSAPLSVAEQLEALRIKTDMKQETLAELVRLDVRTVQRHLSGDTKPNKRIIYRYEQEFSKLLKTQIVISKLP
ncbi:MAG: helix-turn-helix transcriptional regulator [Bryobacteraceae bacterium]